jgi:1-phosphatidylinositol-4-phosphate 5-kinase
LDKIDKQDFLKSINLDDNVDSIFQSGEGIGNSGSFFFFTKDGKYVVKTLRYNEKDTLLDMIDDLYLHYKKTKNQSLITRVYGLYTIKTNMFADVNIYIM